MPTGLRIVSPDVQGLLVKRTGVLFVGVGALSILVLAFLFWLHVTHRLELYLGSSYYETAAHEAAHAKPGRYDLKDGHLESSSLGQIDVRKSNSGSTIVRFTRGGGFRRLEGYIFYDNPDATTDLILKETGLDYDNVIRLEHLGQHWWFYFSIEG